MEIQKKSKIKLIISCIYALFLLGVFLSAYTGNLPGFLNQIPYYDTMGHFILYGIATYLGHSILIKRKIIIVNYSLPLWPVLFTLFTITEEFMQLLSPNRTFSLIDLLASLFGIGCGYWLAEKI